jgi:radical SAM superfamily enzyme YgiQ (UPF0313 family)
VSVGERQDYDAFPIPDRSLLGSYFGGDIFLGSTGATSRSTTLLTSRGCRHRCAFCASGASDFVHNYPLERIDEELTQIRRLGIRDIRVSDDNVTVDERRLGELCELLGRHGMRWRASLRTFPHCQHCFKLMYDSGCVEISFGIESADPVVLKAIRKGQTVESADRAIKTAQAAGITGIRALFMMATPGETRETLQLNKAWAGRHPDVTVCLTAFCPFPGTAIYENPAKFGVRLETLANPNIYAWRADRTEPEAHISIKGGLSRDELTGQLRAFRDWLEERGQINHG